MSTRTITSLPLGQIVATANALAKISQADIDVALQRHATGDWGDLCAKDKETNDRALVEGMRILSVYRAANGIKFWIITEGDHSASTVLLPEDY